MPDDTQARIAAAMDAIDKVGRLVIPGAQALPAFMAMLDAMRASLNAMQALLKERNDAR